MRTRSQPTTYPNPWLAIPAADYEGHMGSDLVGQSPVLNRVFAETLAEFTPQQLAVLGCATGNGFEHIDPAITRRIVGVDLNAGYLDILQQRHGERLPNLSLLCSDVTCCALEPGAFDLVHAALIFEYVDPGQLLPALVEWLKPGGILSVVLQLPSRSSGMVSETPYTSLKALSSIMHLVDPAVFQSLAERCGLALLRSRTIDLLLGKGFHAAYYEKE